MLGRTPTLAAIGNVRLIGIGLALAAVFALAVWAPTQAHAGGCENSWTSSKGGSWFAAENWSKKAVPTSSEDVCITEAGTYAVEMTETSTTVTVKSLTVGAASGTQTLIEASSCSLNATLTTTNGLTIGAHGALTMTNGDGCGTSVSLFGTVGNSGTITTVPAHGGERSLQGDLTNSGTLNVTGTTVFNGAKKTLTNQGAIDLSEGTQLQITGENAVTNATGGKVLATGTGAVVLSGAATTFTEGAGTTSGTRPVIVEDGSLDYTGAGEGPIALRGAGKLAGTSSAGQSLALESTCAKNTPVTAPAGFANGGTLTLTNGDGCGTSVALTVSGGSLSNSGTITTLPGAGGERTIQGTVGNTGTINVNATSNLNGGKSSLSNQGTINLAEGRALLVSAESSVTNGSGGKIVGTGTGAIVIFGAGTSFVQGAGTISGAKPVILEDSSLTYTGSGAGPIALRGASALAGNLSAGQLLALESTCSKHVSVTIPASLTNGGSITMTNGDGCGDNASIAVSSGATLTNSGTLTSEPGAAGGARGLTGHLTNTGTLAINTATTINGAESVLANKAALNIATGVGLVMSGGAATLNENGTIAAAGSGALVQLGGSFTEGAGKTSGSKPVILEDASLSYSGSGEGPISVRGASSLAGNTAAGQSLALESTCSKHAVLTIASSLTNGGSIKMTSGDGCANNTTIAVSSGATLTNSGTITTEKGVGGVRAITGNLANAGTFAVNAGTAFAGSGATLLNSGAIAIAEGLTLAVSGPATVTSSAGTITAAGSGQLLETGGTFNQGAGKAVGIQPVVIEDGALDYTGTGAGTIALRGTSTATGALVKGAVSFPNTGQTLSLQSTCVKHATVTTGPFTNLGAIVMTSGDGCGNNVTVSLGAGTLTNKGTVKAETPHGGARTIEAALVNEKTVTVLAGANLKVQGTYTQSKKGTYATGVAGPSSSGLLSASGAASIAGSLSVLQAKGFLASEGQTFGVLSSSALTGTFSKLKGNKVAKSKPPLKYNPVYSGTGVTLKVGA
jgi:fibronectin-binding autotransporter adhesin